MYFYLCRRSLPSSLQHEINQFAIDGFAKKYFATHKRGLFRRAVPIKELLCWTKDSIKQPLLLASSDKDALKCFKILQVLMNDRPRPRHFNFIESLQSILSCGITKGHLRDEIYVQICRQLNKNPKIQYVTRRLNRICTKGARGKILSAAEIERAMEAPFKPSVFGESLESIMVLERKNQSTLKIPKIVTFLTHAVHHLNGKTTEGIFRVPGDADAVTKLVILNPNVPASLLKYWLRDLADPLVPSEFYDACIKHANDKVKAIEIINLLPDINRRIALYMIRFLQDFTDPTAIEHTLMNIVNLAMVFAPSFLRCPSADLKTIFENSKYEQDFLKTLITFLTVDPDDCVYSDEKNSTTTTINQIFDKNHDYYSFKTSVHEDALNGFTIEYKNYYKIVTNKMTSKTYCLVGFNQDRPEECSIETTIQIPIKTFSIDSDSYQVVPFIELLGLQNNVTKTATVNMTSPCIQDTHIISPDITFSSIHSGAMFKASWILYLGAFFDLELKAFSIYSQISNNYECHKHNLINMKTSSRKGVSWTTYSPSNKLYTVHSDLYYFQLTQDAGGHLEATNVAQGDTFQTDITIDQLALVNALHGAEYIIDTSSIEIDYSTWLNGNALYFTKNDSIQSRIRQVPAIVNHKVYSMNGLVSKNHISGNMIIIKEKRKRDRV
ncbi:uncharacterized protein BX663DRAFT_441361 [Cokeromyces recurvatus]|uniref:uncharacterized protein n=1 Tax=Cokeromyces recurvatus TaxID=90255 RepID=UPI00221F8B2B|nr:uncharacterized protein BX663DRAFT_441361 [Cokeromyces recurvatus]KAI7899381.1 hypothetical protein BX663DRAFT_441361 [Cokeromyces recurvatus]